MQKQRTGIVASALALVSLLVLWFLRSHDGITWTFNRRPVADTRIGAFAPTPSSTTATTPTTTPTPTIDAEKLLREAFDAVSAAKSVHVSGTEDVFSGVNASLDLSLTASGDAVGTVTFATPLLEILDVAVVQGTCYVRGLPDHGFSYAKTCSIPIQGKKSFDLRTLADFNAFARLFSPKRLSPAKANTGDAGAEATVKGSVGSVSISTKGKTLPTSYHGRSVSGLDARLHFSEWNEPVKITPPD